MFVVGKKYAIGRVAYGEAGNVDILWSESCTVIAVAGPVVEFNCNGERAIINVSAPTFAEAKPED